MARRSLSGIHPLCSITMTSEEAVNKLERLSTDPADAHIEADSILVEFLASQGFGAVADAFSKAQDDIGFWYA